MDKERQPFNVEHNHLGMEGENVTQKKGERDLLDNQNNLRQCEEQSPLGCVNGTNNAHKSTYSNSCCSWAFFKRFSPVLMGKHALGVFLIVCVAFIWVGASVWIQYIFGELGYEKPYLMTYFNTTCFALWNFGYLVVPSWRRLPWDNEGNAVQVIFTDNDLKAACEYQKLSSTTEYINKRNEGCGMKEDGKASANNIISESIKTTVYPTTALPTQQDDVDENVIQKPDKKTERMKPYSKLRILKCALFFCPLWFAANYLFNISLSMTSVASNTVLSSSSSIWTLLIAVLFFRERTNIVQVFAVLICFSGVVIVAFVDGKTAVNNDSISGDFLALFSAFFYAGYTTVLKLVLPDDERYSMGMAFGAIGILNFIFFWPGLPIVSVTKFEPFELPTLKQFWPLVLNTLIGTNLSDVLWARGVVLTSPVVATLGLSLTTPLGMVADIIFKGKKFTPLYVVGALFVMVGFILINIESKLSLVCVRHFFCRLKCCNNKNE